MKKRKKRRRRASTRDRLEDIQVEMLDKVARQFKFDVTEIGSFRFSIRVLNRKTLKILATAAQKLGDEMPACTGAILLTAYGLTLYDDGYVVKRETAAQMAEMTERNESEFEMKITHDETASLITKLATQRRSSREKTLSVMLQEAAAALQMQKALYNAKATGRAMH